MTYLYFRLLRFIPTNVRSLFLQGRFQDGNLVRPSPTENKAWSKPNSAQCSIVVPGQLVTEGIGLENGIVLSFSS